MFLKLVSLSVISASLLSAGCKARSYNDSNSDTKAIDNKVSGILLKMIDKNTKIVECNNHINSYIIDYGTFEKKLNEFANTEYGFFNSKFGAPAECIKDILNTLAAETVNDHTTLCNKVLKTQREHDSFTGVYYTRTESDDNEVKNIVHDTLQGIYNICGKFGTKR